MCDAKHILAKVDMMVEKHPLLIQCEFGLEFRQIFPRLPEHNPTSGHTSIRPYHHLLLLPSIHLPLMNLSMLFVIAFANYCLDPKHKYPAQLDDGGGGQIEIQTRVCLRRWWLIRSITRLAEKVLRVVEEIWEKGEYDRVSKHDLCILHFFEAAEDGKLTH